tara:strand:+ start:3303 stop:3563 length:261 start_codon:yes stop_codon:yes gene_type:complete
LHSVFVYGLNDSSKRETKGVTNMTHEQVKAAFFAESFDLVGATESQVEKLDEWLDKNDYYATAWERWNDMQEEMRGLRMEAEIEFA